MSLLFITNDRCLEHVAFDGHPERPSRLTAVAAAIERADLSDAIELVEATPAPLEAVTNVHADAVLDTVERLAAAGGGHIDADTATSAASFDAARLAAGAGLDAMRRLQAGEADTAFCAVRPPGHHATSVQSMGFCLFNNVAVAARALADIGERVVIVDFDAHHGNGTQEIFYDDPRVMFVSFHQWPAYPGTGRFDETGRGEGTGTTINVPLPAGATGDVYLRAWDRVVLPRIESFGPTWVLISAGFDAHRADPITDMGLSAGDYATLTKRILEVAPARQRIVFLEGGYDLRALTESTAAMLGALVDAPIETERETSGGPGEDYVDIVEAHHARVG